MAALAAILERLLKGVTQVSKPEDSRLGPGSSPVQLGPDYGLLVTVREPALAFSELVDKPGPFLADDRLSPCHRPRSYHAPAHRHKWLGSWPECAQGGCR